MPTTTSWLLPSLGVFFCLVLAALAAQTVYVACYRRRFRRATSSAPPSSAGDCERGLLFSPAWSKREGGAPSQEMLLSQLCVMEQGGRQPGDAQRKTRGRPAGLGAAAAAISDGSQPKAARKKVQYASETTRTSYDAAYDASLKEEKERTPAVTMFREKYATRFLSSVRETSPRPKEDSNNNGARTSPAEAEDAGGGRVKESKDGEEPDSFYTPPETPPRFRERLAPKPEQNPG